MQNRIKPNYYAIIPATIRYNNELKPNEKLLYAEITALSQKDGNCYATNSYFANLYEVSNVTISGWISDLEKYGFITRDLIYKVGTKQILNRYLKIIEYPIKEKINTPIKENFKETNINNNTSINTINNNNSEQVAIRPQKHKYGEYNNILLTDDEYQKLLLEENGNDAIEYLSEYIEMKGYKAKSHYLAIKKWVFIALKEQKIKEQKFEKTKNITDDKNNWWEK